MSPSNQATVLITVQPLEQIIHGPPDAQGKRRALVKYQSEIFTLAYYEGSKRVRQKFSDFDKAVREAELVAVKIGNGELEALKLKGHDRADYVRAMQHLAVAAFCGLRSAEIARLDWSEVHLTGPEHYIEVKAAKAKTASRRTVPIPDNCARWLAPFVKESGQVCPFERPDKQCFDYVAPAAQIEWKRNGLRHSFCSYRLAEIKNVHQVSLEAGNSPQMVFGHYRQLVTETQATEWFGIVPPKDWKNVVPMATDASASQRQEAVAATAQA